MSERPEFYPPTNASLYLRGGKRALDLVGAALALVVSLPLMLGVGALVWVSLGRPILFVQIRPGRNERPFRILKFRTMKDSRGEDGNLLPDAERKSAVGAFLRRSSLDEFPELLNVLKGDMSLVGPRPLLMRYLPYFTDQERKRFLMRPGITGLAQIMGRNDLPWERRFARDAEYLETVSLGTDLKILALTIVRVLRAHNVRIVPSASLPDLDIQRAGRRTSER